MTARWELRTESDNAGKPLSVWSWEQYELAQNVNLGLEGGWVFELTFKRRHLGLYPTLKEGKQAAQDHEVSLSGKTSVPAPLGTAESEP